MFANNQWLSPWSPTNASPSRTAGEVSSCSIAATSSAGAGVHPSGTGATVLEVPGATTVDAVAIGKVLGVDECDDAEGSAHAASPRTRATISPTFPRAHQPPG